MDGAGENMSYRAASTRSLKQLGLRGKVMVSLDGGTLHLAGEKEGLASIPVATIDRIRVGWEFMEGKVYRTQVWQRGDGKPSMLVPLRPHTGYAEVTRRLAAEVAAARGVGAVERGVGPFVAFIPLLFMLALLVAIPIGLTLDDAWDSPAAMAIVLIPVFAILYFGHSVWTTHLPRPMQSLDELDIQLP